MDTVNLFKPKFWLTLKLKDHNVYIVFHEENTYGFF